MKNNWKDKYLLNIKEIDEQHKAFFDLWDKGFKDIDANNNKEVTKVIEKLQNYLEVHFEYEEELLKNANFEGLASHIQEHKFFINKVNEFKQELNYKNPMLVEKTALFIKKWFLGHIIQTDKKYENCVIQNTIENKMDYTNHNS